LLDALAAVREAVGIHHGVTVADQGSQERDLVERGGNAAAMLDGIVKRLGGGRQLVIACPAEYLRERLASAEVVKAIAVR